MSLPNTTGNEQDVMKFIQGIAEVFFSEEFNSLRQELETLYYKENVENAFLNAFQDALFSILAQRDNLLNYPVASGTSEG